MEDAAGPSRGGRVHVRLMAWGMWSSVADDGCVASMAAASSGDCGVGGLMS